ncbi:MAG: DNA gyrase inhibitor YacG [Nitrospiraceae bacterium]
MTCRICRHSMSWNDNPWRPFCSERCQLTDLGT